MNHKGCQGELRNLFTRLKSWQEESHREFSNIIDLQSTIIDNSLGNLVKEVDELQAQLCVVKKERDNLLETVANMGSEITKIEAELPSQNAMPDSEERPCQEIDFRRSQDQDAIGGSKINDNDLEDHIDDALNYPETLLSFEGIADEAEVTDQTEGSENDQLSKKGLPERVVNNHDDLKMHTISDQKRGNSKLKCKYCPYTSDWMDKYRTHIESHHQREMSKLKCKYCPYASDSMSRMKDHIAVHKTAKVTNNHDDLKRHIESVHKAGKDRLKCKHCPYWTDWMRDMKDHVEGVHQKARFNCRECKFTRSRKRELMRHIREVHQKGEN